MWLFISGAAGLILGAIFSVIKMIYASAANKKSQKNAEEEANRLYGEDVLRYNNELAADAKRVSDELQQKAVLEDTCRQLKEKHEGTLRTLTKFYDAADIYIIYRNIIAMCLIAEYLKSGICTELTGPHGAFIVCKYEMYEKRKIEQLDKLDKIISQLDQLHFDNQMLDASLKQINSHVSELVDVVDEVKHIQIDNAQKNEQMMTNLSNQIGSYGDKILSQNSVIAYNTECSANELNQIKWLEYYKTFLK